MSNKITLKAEGLEGLFIANNRFNTTSVSFNFYLPMSKETVAENALLPFILTSCSKDYPSFTALNLKLNKLYGARVNASCEKFADCQLLRMSVSVIDDRFSFDSDSLVKEASELLLKLIFNPNVEDEAFLECDVEREKRKAIEHIKGEIAEKRIYAKNRLISEMFAGTPYGIPKCGTVDDVKKVTPKSLYKAWKNMLETAFVRVHVVGAAVPQKLFEDIKSKFETLERHNITDYKACAPAKPAKKVNTVTDKMDVKQGKIVMGFSTDMYGDDDVSLPLMVMCDIFGGGPYSRLFTNVREKMSLCYYCAARSIRFKGLLMVDSGVEVENADKAIDEILNQLEIMKKGEFSDSEFESSIKSICDSLNTYYDSQGALDLWYALKICNENIYSPQDIIEKIKQITREDVIYAARGVNLHTVYKLLPREGVIC
ncbi:MAG: insulinase family protein [Clostridia bacterium]|nr:insulinase family protein [Clostridia bacterium]